MQSILKHVAPYKKIIGLALFLATINQVFSLLDPLIFRFIIDNYATKVGTMPAEELAQGAFYLVLAAMGVALISRIAKNFQEYYVSVIMNQVGTRMYAESVQHTFSLPYSVFEDRRSGEILQKLQKARTDTQRLIESFIGVVFLSAIGIIFVLIYSLTVHWAVTLAFVLIIPALGLFTFYMSARLKGAQKKIVSETAELAGSTTETIRNVELVKSMGLEHQEIGRLNRVNDRILDLELEKVKMVRTLSFIQGTTINAFRSALLFLMLWLVFNGEITLGELFSLLFYSFFIFGPLTEFGRVVQTYQEAQAANEALDEILSLPPQEKPKNATTIKKIETIAFEDVSFHYQTNGIPSVDHITFDIRAGETIALAGASGSGKSTMVKLMVGLYTPTSGKINYNGVDSKKIDFDALRKRVGLVSQETQLFAGTIKENLLFVRPNATEEECTEALRQANILGIIERGDKGLNTKIGEGGIKISGGERQRLAIARALLRNPDMIIFDEATSSLDSLTEQAITETIKHIKDARPNLVVVMIAHRLSTIEHADKIIVLEKGKIIETGTHAQLLKKRGLYSAFWRQQSGDSTRE